MSASREHCLRRTGVWTGVLHPTPHAIQTTPCNPHPTPERRDPKPSIPNLDLGNSNPEPRSALSRLQVVHRAPSSCLGPVVPSHRALSGRLEFTVRRHKFSKGSLTCFGSGLGFRVGFRSGVRLWSAGYLLMRGQGFGPCAESEGWGLRWGSGVRVEGLGFRVDQCVSLRAEGQRRDFPIVPCSGLEFRV